MPYEIPRDKYSQELLNDFFKISRTETLTEEIRSLYNLVNCKLTEDALRKLVKNVDYRLPTIQTENLEILARINDAKFILGDKNKLDCIQNAVEQYLEVHEKTDNLDYLIRPLELVRKVKSAFEPKLPQLIEKILQILPQLKSSYYQLRLVEASMFLIRGSSLKILVDHFIKQLQVNFEKNEYGDANNCIKVLNKLGYWDNTKCRIQTALCMEQKADYYVSQKEPNTYYPTILPIYIEALKEIKGIVVDGELKNRLQQKIKIEQDIYAEMLGKMGVSTQSKSNVTEFVSKLNVEDFKSGFSFLIQFPIIESKLLKSVTERRETNYLHRQFLSRSVHINNKGTVSGIADIEQHDLNFARDHFRNTIISTIREVKLIMDTERNIAKDLVSEMVIKCNSPFIPKDREHFFIEGIYSGFQNNFILASHLLIPQIENSLKHMIELNGRNATKLSEEIQNDNTLGSILGTEENGKMLDGICNRDLLLELHSFLVDGNSTNYRNRICHGLISPFETDYYGIYLWWLTLKMIKQTKNYFTIVQ